MEQPKLWMWTRRNQPNIDHQPLFISPSPFALRLPAARTQSAAIIDDESWEEKAFAEDSSGLLGGCIWPPRSYSCSFCGREFRSAQALGGHMNVHRRDRARLKQSSMVEEEDEEEGQEAGVVGRHNSNVLLNPCPNPNPNYCFEAVSSYGEELRLLKRGVKDEEDELKRGGKLKRINPMMCAPFFVVPSLCERKLPKPEVINLINPEFVEELDLELRLGDSPKLK